jgi:hypothetical protein
MCLDDDFVDSIISEVKNIWPDVLMVRGSPRHSESNGGVERVNRTVQVKLAGCMKQNSSKRWAIGAKFCQWQYNTQIHSTIKDTPYRLTYGQHPRVGLSRLPIDPNVLKSLVTKADLNDLYAGMNAGMFVAPPDPSDICEEFGQMINELTTEVGNVTVEVVDPPQKRTSTGRPGIDESSKKKSRDKQNAIATAVVGLLQSPYCQEIFGKSGGVDDVTSPWEDLLEGSRDTALSQLAAARIGTCFAIMHCINNSDIMNLRNFEPAILKKVGKHTFEVLDVHQRDKVEDNLEMNGNKEGDN